MSQVTILGGCGAVGRVAAKALASHSLFSRVVIADSNAARGEALANELGSKTSFVHVEASDLRSVINAIQGASVVLNCVGPFFKTVKNVLKAVMEVGVNYVDICDDVDVTLELLDMSDEAARRGITALIGMGSSPGATNLLAKLAVTTLLDETDSIDIFHAHGGEPFEGPGVIGHRFHCMSIDIPMYLDGQLKTVKYFEPDGEALRQTFDFPVLGEGIPLYPYPHPEQVTLPRHLKVRQVTNKGTVLPNEYYDLTRELCRLGFNDKAPLTVGDATVTPYDFAVAFIVARREEILRRTRFGQQRGCCSVIVKGKRNGAYREYRFHMASQSQALGEGTGIPAAIGAILMGEGRIQLKGILPPEACIDPLDFVARVPEVMRMDEKKEGGEAFGGIIVQKVDEHGVVTPVAF